MTFVKTSYSMSDVIEGFKNAMNKSNLSFNYDTEVDNYYQPQEFYYQEHAYQQQFQPQMYHDMPITGGYNYYQEEFQPQEFYYQEPVGAHIENFDGYSVLKFNDSELYDFGNGKKYLIYYNDPNNFYLLDDNNNLINKPFSRELLSNDSYSEQNSESIYDEKTGIRYTEIKDDVKSSSDNNNVTTCDGYDLIKSDDGQTYVRYHSDPNNLHSYDKIIEGYLSGDFSKVSESSISNTEDINNHQSQNQTYQSSMFQPQMYHDIPITGGYNYYQEEFQPQEFYYQEPAYQQQFQPQMYHDMPITGGYIENIDNNYGLCFEPIDEKYQEMCTTRNNLKDVINDLQSKFSVPSEEMSMNLFPETEFIQPLDENFDIIDYTAEKFMRRYADPQVDPCEGYLKPRWSQEEIDSHRMYRRANHYIDNQIREEYERIRDSYFKKYKLYDVGIRPVDIDYILYGGVDSANMFIPQTVNSFYQQHNDPRMSALGYGNNPLINNQGMITNVSPVNTQMNNMTKTDYKQGGVTQSVFRTNYEVSNDYEAMNKDDSLLSGYVNPNINDGYTSQPLGNLYSYSYNDNLPYDDYGNQIALMKMIANKISDGKIKFDQPQNQKIEDSEEFKEMKKIYTERYLKYGVTDIDDIRYLVDVHKLRDDELGGPRHRELLERIKQQNSLLLEHCVLQEIETLYIPKLKEMHYNASYRYFNSPDRMFNDTIEQLEKRIARDELISAIKWGKHYEAKTRDDMYKKYTKSDAFKETFEVGTPMQILTGYGSPLVGKSLGDFLENRDSAKKKVEELIEKYNSEDSPLKMGRSEDGTLNITMMPEYKEALKAREYARQRAKELGRDYHQ